MLLDSVSSRVQSVGSSKLSLKKTSPIPGRRSGVGEGMTVGIEVGVSVGGNQTTVGVGVPVAVGVAETNGVNASVGRHALSNGIINSRYRLFIKAVEREA